MSSLGDILHTFPAVTDMRRACPDASIDWVVEEAYVPLAAMHPGVTRVSSIALRRWRRQLLSPTTWSELGAFRRGFRGRNYDVILDTQGLLKSAWVAKLPEGKVYGFGPGTAREPLAARFYDVKLEFAAADHKIERYREVAARALGYQRPALLDYGVSAPPRPSFAPPSPYCVLLHSTARAAKRWSEEAWQEVVGHLERRGWICVVPWGDEEERLRSDRIASAGTRVQVPPRMTIIEAAGLVGHAEAVLGVDTGLMHLAAALRVPVVGIFCDSEPLDAKPLGAGKTAFRGGVGKPPSAEEVLGGLAEVL
jgi:heptosyltransferase-1